MRETVWSMDCLLSLPMRLLSLAVMATVGCTTVVQEPADLDPARVEALRLEDDGGTAVRIRSAEGWGRPGEILTLTNRLTGVRVTTPLDAAGLLDSSIGGQLDDVYSVSHDEVAPHAPQLGSRDGATIHAWGWGFGGLDGCDVDGFEAGTIAPGPAHDHEVCSADAAAAPLYPDHEVPAVGTSRLGHGLELLEAPVLRFRASAHVAGDVIVRLATAEGTYEAGHRVETTTWETRSLQAGEFHHGDTVLVPGLVVTAIWIAADGHAPAEGLAVDDVVVESAIEHD